MAEFSFYHLQRQGLDDVLPRLLEKAYGSGQRAVVLAGSVERTASLDSLLWIYKRESFLPHGIKGGGHAEEQPVYLTTEMENPNKADFLFVVDGVFDLDFASKFQRCFDLFDGNDEIAVAAARDRWGLIKAAGHKLIYWQQSEAGSWEKKAEA